MSKVLILMVSSGYVAEPLGYDGVPELAHGFQQPCQSVGIEHSKSGLRSLVQ